MTGSHIDKGWPLFRDTVTGRRAGIVGRARRGPSAMGHVRHGGGAGRSGAHLLLASLCATHLLLASGPARAQERPVPPATGLVAAVDGFGDLVLEDGRVLRLAGLAVPADAEGVGEAAYRAALAPLVGQTVHIAPIGARADRHGRLPVLLTVDPEGAGSVRLNERLIADGLAVVRPEPGLGDRLPALLAAEVPARQAGRGLWAQLPIPASDVARLAAREGRFTILAGRVLSVGKGRAVDYLNFGPVWRHDATVRLEKSARAALEAAGTTPESLAGHRVLARGVVQAAGGPAITVEEAGQIARLDEWDGKRAGTW